MLLFITSNKQKHQQKGCLLRAAGNSFFTLPSFLYWEVFEPVSVHILTYDSRRDNIFEKKSTVGFLNGNYVDAG